MNETVQGVVVEIPLNKIPNDYPKRSDLIMDISSELKKVNLRDKLIGFVVTCKDPATQLKKIRKGGEVCKTDDLALSFGMPAYGLIFTTPRKVGMEANRLRIAKGIKSDLTGETIMAGKPYTFRTFETLED